MWFGPLWMFVWLVVAVIVAMIGWLSEKAGSGDKPARSARDILDARGEIDRDEYMKRKQDIAGR